MEFIASALAIYCLYILWKNVVKAKLFNDRISISTERGLLAVRAATYLLLMMEHCPKEIANQQAFSLYAHNVPHWITKDAMQFMNTAFEGNQLAMISQARKLGFMG